MDASFRKLVVVINFFAVLRLFLKVFGLRVDLKFSGNLFQRFVPRYLADNLPCCSVETRGTMNVFSRANYEICLKSIHLQIRSQASLSVCYLRAVLEYQDFAKLPFTKLWSSNNLLKIKRIDKIAECHWNESKQ